VTGFLRARIRSALTRIRRGSAEASVRLAGHVRRRIRVTKVEGKFPAQLAGRKLYVLTEDGVPWQAAMICPCGCQETLELNLLPDERPRWRFSIDAKGRASLSPSVWRKIGCHSHFWLRNGWVVWVSPRSHH
jgi:hypothetical protein